jgi:formylglycine-generating enzyme required for sulfatase activity
MGGVIMNWVYLLVLAVGLACPAAAAHADPERRVALIIGNDAYRKLPKLENAASDARLMERELKAAGFDPVVKINAGRKEMNNAINDFAGKLSAGAVGLFYYAGHGIQAKDRNYLIPVDADVETEADLESDAVDAGKVTRAMEEAHNRLNIVVLDACRDNPLPKGRSASRGLAVMPAPTGTFVAYATGPGQIAQDGAKGGNGVFTGELAKALREPGLSIEQVFKKAAGGVRERTGGKQVPWIQASIQGDFYFRPPNAVAPVVRNDGGSSGGTDKETVFWQSIQNSSRASDFQAYLDKYPSGDFVALARSRLDELKGAKVATVAPVAPKPERREAQPAAVSPLPPPKASGGTRSPGTVFRDCPDCPEMVVIPAGSFTMGSDAVEQDWYVAQGGDRGAVGRESPQHRVTISQPFAVGKYAVTQAEWEAVMGSNPSKFKGSRNPVEQVSWNDAQDFVNRLNAKVRSVVQVSTGGNGPYRLLTEAEWEYAARAGTTTKFPWGDSIGSGNANCDGCGSQWDKKTTAPVGSFRPNAFGIYDMHGNVWQWVQDCYVDSYAGVPSDGSAVTGDDSCYRVNRGGSWNLNPRYLRSATRSGVLPGRSGHLLGFRLARTL